MKLKIVHVADYLMPQLGYQEFLLAKWNARHGHEVHIVTSDRYTPVPDYEESWGKILGPRICGSKVETIAGVTVHRLKCAWEIKTRPWIKNLGREIARLQPDAIFCHASASFTAFRVARLAKKKGTPVFFDNHLSYVSLKRDLARSLLYRLLRSFSHSLLNGDRNRFFGVSPESCDILEKVQHIPPRLIEYLPFGIDTDFFFSLESNRGELRRKHAIPENARVVMQTGKLVAEKGPHILARAMAELMPHNEDLWLVYVGGGSRQYLQEVLAPLQARGVMSRVVQIPFVPVAELRGHFAAADICVYPAQESLSAFEAAACGCAVIMTDLPNCREREKAGIGICYRNGDDRDLAAKIEELLVDAERRRRLADKARTIVARDFSYDAVAARVEKSFMRMLAETHETGGG